MEIFQHYELGKFGLLQSPYNVVDVPRIEFECDSGLGGRLSPGMLVTASAFGLGDDRYSSLALHADVDLVLPRDCPARGLPDRVATFLENAGMRFGQSPSVLARDDDVVGVSQAIFPEGCFALFGAAADDDMRTAGKVFDQFTIDGIAGDVIEGKIPGYTEDFVNGVDALGHTSWPTFVTRCGCAD